MKPILKTLKSVFSCKCIIGIALLPSMILAQPQTEKVIREQVQTWVSLNTLTKFNEHWGVVADAHIRTNGVFESPNFYFLRGGLSYIPNNLVSITGGYGHMWVAPTVPGWSTYSDENRIYQQVQWNSKVGKINMLQRIRNEQRWQEKIVNDEPTGDNRFTDRFRYLLSFNIAVFKNKNAPSFVFSDEVLVQFGREVVYNPFDQNRIFIGIKQTINPELSFDFGYMNVYQQRYLGYLYDMNHTLRLFFYLNTSPKINTHPNHFNAGDE